VSILWTPKRPAETGECGQFFSLRRRQRLILSSKQHDSRVLFVNRQRMQSLVNETLTMVNGSGVNGASETVSSSSSSSSSSPPWTMTIPHPFPVSTLTDTQEKILSLLPILPSLLSILGSLTIVHMVVTSKRKTTPYKRLLLGMSLCDIVSSLSIPFWAFLLPQESISHSRVWAMGNATSCTALGFFSQFAFSGILYNGMLSYYYLLTVRFAYQDRQMERRVEPLMHILSIGFPTITALIGAIVGVYSDSEIGLQCWVDNYPKGCGDHVGVPCLSPLIGWIFGGWIMVFMIVSMVVNNVTIYLFVRRTIYRSRQQQRELSSFGASTTPSSTLSQSGSIMMDSQTRRVQAVATQAFLYVGSFVLTYAWQLILRIVEGSFGDASWESSLFPILVLNGIFMPLQGVFNLLVCARPNYLRARKDYPQESPFWCFRRALHGDAIRPNKSKSKSSSDGASSLSPRPSS
jgi:hypothetical protein